MSKLTEAVIFINLMFLPVYLTLTLMFPQMHDVRMLVDTRSVVVEKQCGQKKPPASGRKYKI